MNFQKIIDWMKTSYLVKNAVNAAVLSLVQMYHDPADNNFHDWHGIKGILWQVGAAILAREGMIVVPKIIKWSTTNGGMMKVLIVAVLTLFVVAPASAHKKPSLAGTTHHTIKISSRPIKALGHATAKIAVTVGGFSLSAIDMLVIDPLGVTLQATADGLDMFVAAPLKSLPEPCEATGDGVHYVYLGVDKLGQVLAK